MAVERLTYTVTEVAEILGLSRSKTYELVAIGEIPVLPIPGRRKLVARSTVRGLVGEAVRDGDGAARSTWRRTHQIGAAARPHTGATQPGRAAASGRQ